MIVLVVLLFVSSAVARNSSSENKYRLPKSLLPLQYDLTFVPHLGNGWTFEGRETILFKVVEATETITLHKDGLSVVNDSLEVRGGDGEIARTVTETTEDAVTNFFVIFLDGELEKGQNYSLSMNYFGNIRDDMTGIYKSFYYTSTGEKKVMLTTQFEATNARRAYLCFDEAWMKATYSITISRPGNMTSVSNMPQDGPPVKHMDTPDGVGLYWDRYMISPPMSTYIVAFIISDFANISDPLNNIRVFARPELIKQAYYSLDSCSMLLTWYSEYTDTKYMLPKMDLIGIPDFEAGAMENWGEAHFRERVLLLEEGVTTTEAKQLITSTVAHEIAHQWFGDLVTPSWWSYTWLSEGFAEFFAYYSSNVLFPTWRMMEQFVVIVQHRVMVVDSFGITRPPSTVIDGSPAAVSSVFDDISYAKGASLIKMMNRIITPEAFQKGIQKYLKIRSYGVATPKFLFKLLTKEFQDIQADNEPKLNLTTIMDTWTNQNGYPVVIVKRNYALSTASITQVPFILKNISRREERPPKWVIPLSYTTQRDLDFTSQEYTYLWKKPLEINTTASSEEWMLFNINQTGFYRVNYDSKNWMLLTAYLNSDNFTLISPVNRAQLIDDSFNLARSGLVDYCIPLALSKYLTREVDLIPIKAFFTNFEFIYSRLSYSYDNYIQKYILQLMEPMYDRIGFDVRKNDDHVTKLTRAMIVDFACKLGHDHCLRKSVKFFHRSMSLSRSHHLGIPADLQKSVYCSAVQMGGIQQWNYLWNIYKKTSSPGLQALIIEVLCCSTSVSTLTHYLEMSVEPNSPVRIQDRFPVFYHMLHRRVDVALDFFITHYQAMEKAYGEMNNFVSCLGRVASVINTKHQIMKLKDFFHKIASDDEPKKMAFKRAIATVDETLDWQKTRGKFIISWVENEMTNQDNSLTCERRRLRAPGSTTAAGSHRDTTTKPESEPDFRNLNGPAHPAPNKRVFRTKSKSGSTVVHPISLRNFLVEILILHATIYFL